MKRNKYVILTFIFIFLFIIIEKNVLASEIDLKAESNYENFSNYVNIQVSSNVEMEKIYIYRKNNNERYTIFKLINAHNEKKVDCRISFDKLSKTNDTEIKVLVVNKDKTNAEKTIKISKIESNRKPIPSVSQLPKTPVVPKSSNGGMTTKKPTPKVPSKTPSNPKGSTQATKISLPSSQTVSVGESAQLDPTISPDNAEKKVTWSTSDQNIVTVSSTGTIKGIAKGNANITAKTSNGLTATCTVTVNESTDTSFDLEHAKKVSAEIHSSEHENLKWHGKVIGRNGGMIGAYVEAINILNNKDYTLKEIYKKIISAHPKQKYKNKPVYENTDINDYYNIKVSRASASISNIKKALEEGKVVAELANTTKWRNGEGKTFGKSGQHTGLIFYYDGKYFHMKTSVQKDGLYTESQLKDWLKDAKIDLIIYSKK